MSWSFNQCESMKTWTILMQAPQSTFVWWHYMYVTCVCIDVQPPLLYVVIQALRLPLPPPPTLPPHSVSHPSPPWWAAWFAGECVIWISTSVSVYQPDSWDVAAQKFLFSLPPPRLNPVDFFPPSLSLNWRCNHIVESQSHSVNHLNNLYKLKLSNESLIWLLWKGRLNIYSPLKRI